METGKAVALAGIAATAVVGIAGATASWLIARDDQTNQQRLAHDDRVYTRRADAYLAALALIERQHTQIERDYESIVVRHELADGSDFPMALGSDATLAARVTAFGSTRVVAAYSGLHSIAQRLSVAEYNWWERASFADSAERARIVELLGDTVDRSLGTFEERQHQFELLVQKELS